MAVVGTLSLTVGGEVGVGVGAVVGCGGVVACCGRWGGGGGVGVGEDGYGVGDLVVGAAELRDGVETSSCRWIGWR